MKGRHFLRIADWTRDELEQVLELASDLKRRLKAGDEHRLLPGRQLGMVFDKPSTRTRISFEVGMTQLGGHALFLQAADLQLGHGEPIRATGVELVRDAREAAAGAHVLYTDTWVSMGQENERVQRLRDLQGYAIDDELLALAQGDAIVMHCLPAHYGEEVSEEILHGPRSAAWDEAENR